MKKTLSRMTLRLLLHQPVLADRQIMTLLALPLQLQRQAELVMKTAKCPIHCQPTLPLRSSMLKVLSRAYRGDY
jgi:hypothetical protein